MSFAINKTDISIKDYEIGMQYVSFFMHEHLVLLTGRICMSPLLLITQIFTSGCCPTPNFTQFEQLSNLTSVLLKQCSVYVQNCHSA